MHTLIKLFGLICLIGVSLFVIILVSHITWFPGLLQVVANNFDPHRYYQPTDQEYLRMIQDPNFCTKNEDCQTVCRASGLQTNCNSKSINTYSETEIVCGQQTCRPELFTVSICQQNKCVIRGY